MTPIRQKLIEIKERADDALEDKAERFRLNQDCTCEFPDKGTCWYHLSREEQGRWGFRAGFNSRYDEFEALSKALEIAEAALKRTKEHMTAGAAGMYGNQTQMAEEAALEFIDEVYIKWLAEAQTEILKVLNFEGEEK